MFSRHVERPVDFGGTRPQLRIDQPVEEVSPRGGLIVQPLPDEVKRFLEENIDSVDQLEILRVLGEDPHKEWSFPDLARETQTPPEAIAAHLSVLQSRGLLLTHTRDTVLFCRYGPTSPERASVVERLLQVYRERPVSMIKLVYARAKDPLKTFAEAFRLKKES